MATVARFEDVLLTSKTSKSTKHVSNISYQIMTTQADQFKTAPYTSLNKSDQVKFKQSAGELLLVFLVTLVYLGTITGSVLPR